MITGVLPVGGGVINPKTADSGDQAPRLVIASAADA
jgi:hypothetical protein